MEAIWSMDYDFRMDQTYQRPCCPKCEAPIWKEADGYRCISCGELIEVNDPEMIKWIDLRNEEKVEMEDCPLLMVDGKQFGCGGKRTVEVHMVRNHVTLQWQVAWGKCNSCGRLFIV